MFGFANPICWLKKKTIQHNLNTKKLCGLLSTGGLVSQQFNPNELNSWWAGSKIDPTKICKKNQPNPIQTHDESG